MLTVRRVYLLFVSAASLAMWITGVVSIGGTLIEQALSPSTIASSFRQSVAESAALALVGLPIWALHWSIAQRLARGDPAERTATLRRLYLYAVAGSLMLSVGVFGKRMVEEGLLLVLRDNTGDGVRLLRAAWDLAICLALWGYHIRCVGNDRRVAGETGGSATLRRWYAYATMVVAAVIVLFGARELLTTVGLVLVDAQPVGARHVAGVVGATLAGLAIGVLHARWTATAPTLQEDRRSTLRAVAGFGVLALSVAMAISQASRALYYALARLLGVENPGGERSDIAGLLVSPAATILIFGIAWALTRRALVADAAEVEVPRQAGVRRLYAHLVSLVALAAFTTGVGGILWTLIDILSDRSSASGQTAHRDQLSLFLTLIVVGLPMWLAHWRPTPESGERAALSRRLYLFAALLASVLTILGSGAYTIQRLLALLLGAGTPAPWTDIEHAAAVTAVALGVAVYHWRVLRGDGEERAASPAPPPPEQPTSLVVEVVGATEGEIATALAALPASASYRFRGPA